jgi:calcium-dependent protein kinase
VQTKATLRTLTFINLRTEFLRMGCSGSKDPVLTPNPLTSETMELTFNSKYKTDKLLGEGAYGIVKLCINVRSRAKYAVKIVKKENLHPKMAASFKQESDIMKMLQHKNIVSFYDFFDEPAEFCLVIELLEGGELFDRIVKKKRHNEKEARDLVLTIANAIKYMHEQHIVHRYCLIFIFRIQLT